MKIIKNFNDYKIIDMNDGEKLEKWADIILRRPDPQIIWSGNNDALWNKTHASYNRSDKGGGSWSINKKIPKSWIIEYEELKFNLKLMNFKHTGLFPEQAYNWDYIRNNIKQGDKVLNLFAYTGGATIAALSKDAEVVHVDSSRGMVEWAKENVILNKLQDKTVRFIVDDVVKFVKREIRRGNKYDAIIMDPPSFGKGSKGEIWKFEKDFYELLKLCSELLTNKSSFVIISSYTTGLSNIIIENCVKKTLINKYGGKVSSDEIGFETNKMILPCGNYTRWENN